MVDNGEVRIMTQAEQDALIAEEEQAIIDAENARIAGLNENINGADNLTIDTIDTKINAIGNLADAKTFLKKLCRFIIKYVAKT